MLPPLVTPTHSLYVPLCLLPLLLVGWSVHFSTGCNWEGVNTLPAVRESKHQYLPQQLDITAWHSAHLILGQVDMAALGQK